MKGCEPRDLLDRVTDLCLFEGQPLELTPRLIDTAWRNYFGTSHSFANGQEQPAAAATPERAAEEPLQL